MWILVNSTELLNHLKSPNFNLITNIKSFDLSTLNTTIPHQKLKSRLATIIRNSFLHKNGNRRYKYLVLGREGPYFVKEHSDSKNKYTEEDIIKMLEFLVDNIFVVFAGKVFQQIIGIPMKTNRRRSDPVLWQKHKTVPLSWPTYFYTRTKQNSYSPCSRPVRSG